MNYINIWRDWFTDSYFYINGFSCFIVIPWTQIPAWLGQILGSLKNQLPNKIIKSMK